MLSAWVETNRKFNKQREILVSGIKKKELWIPTYLKTGIHNSGYYITKINVVC
jgi:hypothetical protein